MKTFTEHLQESKDDMPMNDGKIVPGENQKLVKNTPTQMTFKDKSPKGEVLVWVVTGGSDQLTIDLATPSKDYSLVFDADTIAKLKRILTR